MYTFGWQRAIPKQQHANSLVRMQAAFSKLGPIVKPDAAQATMASTALAMFMGALTLPVGAWQYTFWSEYRASRALAAQEAEEAEFSGNRYGGVYEAKA